MWLMKALYMASGTKKELVFFERNYFSVLRLTIMIIDVSIGIVVVVVGQNRFLVLQS